MSYTIEEKSYMIHTLIISGCKFHSDPAGVSGRKTGSDQDLSRFRDRWAALLKCFSNTLNITIQ